MIHTLLCKIHNEIIRLIFFPLIRIIYRKINVLNIHDTLCTLINSNKSLCRFGDGEISWILMDNKNSFERNSIKLRDNLIRVLNSDNKDLMIGLPGIINGSYQLSRHHRHLFQMEMIKNGFSFIKYLNKKRKYYNTDITRFYIEYKSDKQATKYFKKIKEIWQNKRVLIVEGRKTRFGVGNNLLDNVDFLKRIECPPVNAFEHYNDILSYVLKICCVSDFNLVLVSLGPTATILSYDLFKKGFRAIDIGHLDLEYEWYLMGAKKIINVSTRYVNDLSHNRREGYNVIPIRDKKYNSEILKVIK